MLSEGAAMPDKYDPYPDLGKLLDAALRSGWYALPYVERLADGLGPETSAGPEAAERLLRKALGLPAGTCETVSTASGIVCGRPAARYSGTCGCGHPRDGWLCEGCRAKSLWCRTCYRLGRGGAHECAVTLPPAGALARAVAPGQVTT
jgi:hypothetical protein